MRGLSIFFLAALVWTGAAHAAPLDDLVRSEIQNRHIPGLSLAVVKENQLVASRGYGLANIETATPATPQTVYKIASLSKAFIADAILLLAQDGKLSLDDPARKYLTDAPPIWHDITIRQLLNHTSGIVRDPTDYHPYDPQPVMEVIRNAYTLPLAAPPGEKMLYSNLGYYVLAEIVSRASGTPWDNYIAQYFFVPAGMTTARLTTSDIVPNRAAGYHWADGAWHNAEDWIAVRPSGAFLSSVQDMSRWEAFQNSPAFPLTPESRALSVTPGRLNDGATSPYAMRWYAESFLGQSRIHHDGQYPGFRADYEKFGHGVCVIVLANDDNGGLESLALKIAALYDKTLVPPAFSIAATTTPSAQAGKPIDIHIEARDEDRSAPASLVEMEIWDSAGKPVFKQHLANMDFAAGEDRQLDFAWTPEKPGIYTVNIGAYGPKWVTGYAWHQGAATITVN